jgi:hypothetical protein
MSARRALTAKPVCQERHERSEDGRRRGEGQEALNPRKVATRKGLI